MATVYQKLILSNKIMALDPHQNPDIDPMIHRGFYSLMLQMRKELYCLGELQKQRRQKALKILYDNDTKEEDANLRMIGRAYTYP